MKQLSKLWLDLFFCLILIVLTGHTSNYFPKNNSLFQQDLLPKLVKLSENNQR